MKYPSLRLRDLLYLDFDKAASIWSQLEEGLLEHKSVTEDTTETTGGSAKVGISGLISAKLGADFVDKRLTLESKTLHHNVLTDIEDKLMQMGLVTDLSKELKLSESSAEKIRETIGNRPYLRAEGTSVIEDYKRILTISEQFKNLVSLITRSHQEAIKQSAEYKQLQEMVESAKGAADGIKDRNQKASEKDRLQTMQRQLNDLTKPQLDTPEDWILNGIKLVINIFMPNRINFRIYPFPDYPSFQILCNLKRDCFVDSDLEHLLYGYGNYPNVPLTVFGLITSLPEIGSPAFDPMKEFDTDKKMPQNVALEKSFREILRAMDGLEALVRYSRYPNITVHPIAVYRSFPTGGQ